jgi:hypothetical protein
MRADNWRRLYKSYESYESYGNYSNSHYFFRKIRRQRNDIGSRRCGGGGVRSEQIPSDFVAKFLREAQAGRRTLEEEYAGDLF